MSVTVVRKLTIGARFAPVASLSRSTSVIWPSWYVVAGRIDGPRHVELMPKCAKQAIVAAVDRAATEETQRRIEYRQRLLDRLQDGSDLVQDRLDELVHEGAEIVADIVERNARRVAK